MKTLLLLLAAGLPLAIPQPGDPKAEYDEILGEYHTAMDEFRASCAEIEKAEGAEALAEFRASWSPAGHFVTVFQEKAKEYAGTRDAVRFLQWIVFNAPAKEGETGLPEPARAALGTILEAHPKDAQAQVANLPYTVYEQPKDRCLAVADALIAASPDDAFRCTARLARAGVLMNASASQLDAAEKKAAIADVNAVIESGNESLVTSAKRALFELEHLQIGDVAPDISGKDTDGVAFKLSDYRGKVVMLDFWGDW